MPLPARFSQADVARALRVLDRHEGWRLRILPDGSMVIEKGERAEPKPEKALEASEGYRL